MIKSANPDLEKGGEASYAETSLAGLQDCRRTTNLATGSLW